MGASLVARDNVVETVGDLSDQLHDARRPGELRSSSAAARTARNRFEREVRKNRTKVERTLRTRRNRVEREIKAFRRDFDKQATSTRKNVVTQAEVAQTRVEALVKDLQAEFTKRVQSVAYTTLPRPRRRESRGRSTAGLISRSTAVPLLPRLWPALGAGRRSLRTSIASPGAISPATSTSARRPPRPTSSRNTPVRSRSVAHGSHRRSPRSSTAPMRKRLPTRSLRPIPRVTTLRPESSPLGRSPRAPRPR